MQESPTLYYIHDPMCSWCWAFAPTWEKLQAQLPDTLRLEYIVGGLAPDTDKPMPQDQRNYIQSVWRNIQTQLPQIPFNYDFWSKCAPRRSTYVACRAVIVAKQYGAKAESTMIQGIQEAYYLQARNPSDQTVLASLAEDLGICSYQFFQKQLNTTDITAECEKQIQFARSIGVSSFPSLILYHQQTYHPISLNYQTSQSMSEQIQQILLT